MPQTGAEVFVQAAQQLGIGKIFTLVGDHLNEVLGAAARAGIQIIDMRHESGVTHAADAFARVTRRPALSMVTGGPGHTNSLTGIATHTRRKPPDCGERLACHEHGGTRGLSRYRAGGLDAGHCEVGRAAAQCLPDPVLPRPAFAEADSGRKGPVHLTIPHDVFTSTTETATGAALPAASHAAAPSSTDVERAIKLLRTAQRPVVLAGSGVWWARAEAELQRFIEKTSLPLYTVTMGKGVVSDEHPLVMGYGDPALNRAALRAFQEADLFLIPGKRIDYRLALGGPRLFPGCGEVYPGGYPSAGIGNEPAARSGYLRGREGHLGRPGRGGRQAGMGASAVARQDTPAQGRVAAHVETCMADRAAPIHPAAFYAELSCVLPRDVLYSWDGGDFTHWGRYLRQRSSPVAGCAWAHWLPSGQGCPTAWLCSSPTRVNRRLYHRRWVLGLLPGGAGYAGAAQPAGGRDRGQRRLLGHREAVPGSAGMERTVACDLRASRYDLIMQAFGEAGRRWRNWVRCGPRSNALWRPGNRI